VELLGLFGVRDPVREAERLSFAYQGDVKRLLAALANAPVVDPGHGDDRADRVDAAGDVEERQPGASAERPRSRAQ